MRSFRRLASASSDGVCRIEHVDQVEIAVAGVADQADGEWRACVSCFVSTTHSARREIGTQTSVVQPRAPGRSASAAYKRVVARLPEAFAILEARRPLKRVAAAFGGDRLHGFRLLGDVALAVAVELEEERRRHRVAGLRVAVDRVELHFVEQLDPRDRHAELNRRDHRLDRALDRVERAHRGRHRLGTADAAAASPR